jgi:hypothetical protein
VTLRAAARPFLFDRLRVGHRRRSCSGANGVGPVPVSSRALTHPRVGSFGHRSHPDDLGCPLDPVDNTRRPPRGDHRRGDAGTAADAPPSSVPARAASLSARPETTPGRSQRLSATRNGHHSHIRRPSPFWDPPKAYPWGWHTSRVSGRRHQRGLFRLGRAQGRSPFFGLSSLPLGA